MLVYAQDREATGVALADIGITMDGDHCWVPSLEICVPTSSGSERTF